MKVIPLWRERRERRGLSVREACDAIGITQGGLNQLELGKTHAKRSILERACDVYDCQPGDLYIAVPEEVLKRTLANP